MTNDREQYILPAEWAAQSMVQLTWPHEATDWQPILKEITDTYVTMAVEIAKREPLLIVAPHPEKVLQAIRPHATAKEMGRIETFACDTNDTWARDHGFITLTNGKTRRLLDFRFNGWGEKFEAGLDDAINKKLYDAGTIDGEYESHLDFVLEGGSIESDGKGTIFTTTRCLMAPHRNQPLSRQQIEEKLKETLRADRIQWIDCSQLPGDDTDGHIDTVARVAPNDTLLYIDGDPILETSLKELRTTDGLTYRLLKLPGPRPIIADGELLPATYANFLVINSAVLYPTYNQPDNDEEARRIIAEAFPDREPVGIDCRNVIVQHGSLHCCTMQFPQ